MARSTPDKSSLYNQTFIFSKDLNILHLLDIEDSSQYKPSQFPSPIKNEQFYRELFNIKEGWLIIANIIDASQRKSYWTPITLPLSKHQSYNIRGLILEEMVCVEEEFITLTESAKRRIMNLGVDF